jgi:hypothetical protein
LNKICLTFPYFAGYIFRARSGISANSSKEDVAQWLIEEGVFEKGEMNQALRFVCKNGMNGRGLLALTEEDIKDELELPLAYKRLLLIALGNLEGSAICMPTRELCA